MWVFQKSSGANAISLRFIHHIEIRNSTSFSFINVNSRHFVNRFAYFRLLHITNEWLALKSIPVSDFIALRFQSEWSYFCRSQIGVSFIDLFCEMFSFDLLQLAKWTHFFKPPGLLSIVFVPALASGSCAARCSWIVPWLDFSGSKYCVDH